MVHLLALFSDVIADATSAWLKLGQIRPGQMMLDVVDIGI